MAGKSCKRFSSFGFNGKGLVLCRFLGLLTAVKCDRACTSTVFVSDIIRGKLRCRLEDGFEVDVDCIVPIKETERAIVRNRDASKKGRVVVQVEGGW